MQNTSSNPDSARPARILCVEDDALLREMIQTTLELLGGFEVNACRDGERALESLACFEPDLLLLDANLPGMDGPTLLNAYRNQAGKPGLPAAFLTGQMGDEAIHRLRQSGANAVFLKPIAPTLLVEQIRRLLEPSPDPAQRKVS